MQLILRGLFCHFLTDRATWKQWWIFRKVVEPLSLPIALCAKISRPSPCHHPLNSNEAVGLLRPCVPNCPTFARFSRDLNLRQRSGTAIVHWNAESKHTFGSWSKSSGDRFRWRIPCVRYLSSEGSSVVVTKLFLTRVTSFDASEDVCPPQSQQCTRHDWIGPWTCPPQSNVYSGLWQLGVSSCHRTCWFRIQLHGHLDRRFCPLNSCKLDATTWIQDPNHMDWYDRLRCADSRRKHTPSKHPLADALRCCEEAVGPQGLN